MSKVGAHIHSVGSNNGRRAAPADNAVNGLCSRSRKRLGSFSLGDPKSCDFSYGSAWSFRRNRKASALSRSASAHTTIETLPIIKRRLRARWSACLWRNRFIVTDLLELRFYKHEKLYLMGISTIFDHQVKLIEEITQPAVAVLLILLN